MKRIVQTALLTAAISFVIAISFAVLSITNPAQAGCEAGQANDGNCANPAMTTAAIQSATIFAQPNLSKTAHPVAASEDRKYRYPNELIPNQLPQTFFRPKIIGG